MSSTIYTAVDARPASNGLSNLAVLIPAWQPEAVLIELVQKLVVSGFSLVLVVDDGSSADSLEIFQQLESMSEVRLLRHAVNRGKGSSLKTGLKHVLTELPQIQGVITADADGQHLVADIVHVAETFSRSTHRVVLGTRIFAADVPLRSRFGNQLTRRLFALLTGVRLADTQTGLRALPRALIGDICMLSGERYEYEMCMLALLCRNGHQPVEVPIHTIYFDGNRGSHFHPLWDSIRIYIVLLRASFAPLRTEAQGFAADTEPEFDRSYWTRQRIARIVWIIAVVWTLTILLSLRLGLLDAFFFDTNRAHVQGIDFFGVERAWLNLFDGRSAFDTFRSSYGPYATAPVYHPAIFLLIGPWLMAFSPWSAYGVWTLVSVALMLLSAFIIMQRGDDPLRRAFVALLLVGSFPGILMLHVGNVQAVVILACALVFTAFDDISQNGCTQHNQKMLLTGLLLSLFSKPVVLMMLPLLLLLQDTRRTALRAIATYIIVSFAFLFVPGLNPVAMEWSQRWFLFLHPDVVQQTMNLFTNGFNVTPPMQDNAMHWLTMRGMAAFRMEHIDVYSLPALCDVWLGRQTPDALFQLPILFVLAVTALVAFVRDRTARMEAALMTLMAASLLLLLSYGLVWEYHFTLILPIAALLLMRKDIDAMERAIIALTVLIWLPSLYVLLRNQDVGLLSVQMPLHAERVLSAGLIFALLLVRAIRIALGLRLQTIR
jgi:glycosyltransferase involved in cell wall biosynthesis